VESGCQTPIPDTEVPEKDVRLAGQTAAPVRLANTSWWRKGFR